MCYCIKELCLCVRKDDKFEPFTVIAGSKELNSKSENVNLHVNSCVVNPVLFVKGSPQKKGVNPRYWYYCQRIKCVKDFSCVNQLYSVNLVTNVPTVALDLSVGARWDQSQGGNSTQRRLHPPLLVPAKFDQVTNCHKLLCESPQEPLLAGGFASASDHKCSGTGGNSKIPGFLQHTIFGTQTQPLVETYL